jgi:hypothetical protein
VTALSRSATPTHESKRPDRESAGALLVSASHRQLGHREPDERPGRLWADLLRRTRCSAAHVARDPAFGVARQWQTIPRDFSEVLEDAENADTVRTRNFALRESAEAPL